MFGRLESGKEIHLILCWRLDIWIQLCQEFFAFFFGGGELSKMYCGNERFNCIDVFCLTLTSKRVILTLYNTVLLSIS